MRKKQFLILASCALVPSFLASCQKEPATYQATFYDWDSTVLLETTVKQGQEATYTGATPTRAHDEAFTYTFSGWDRELKNVQENVLFHAVYSKQTYVPEVKQYTVDFHNYDGSLLSSSLVQEGKFASYGGQTPTRAMDETNTYAFAGWDKDLTKYAIMENTTFTAQFTSAERLYSYVAEFVNWDGTLINKQNVEKGSFAKAPGNPTREQDTTNTYAFKQWDKDPLTTAIVANTRFVAQFDATVRKYHVTFVNYDGELLDEMDVEAGKTAVTSIPNPERPASDTLYYTFAGWNVDPTSLPIYANTTFVAQYNNHVLAGKFLMTFKNYDGAILLQGYVEEGHLVLDDLPEFQNLRPVRPSQGNVSYTFSGWNVNPATYAAERAMTFVATYTENVATVSYPVEFRNYDGQLLLSASVQAGKTCAEARVNYASLNPVRSEGVNLHYTFAGWDQDPTALAITQATTFFAKYSTTKFYTIQFVNYDWTLLRNERFGEGDQIAYNNTVLPTRPADETGTYVFSGWDEALGKATSDKTFIAQYTKTAKQYEVRFLNYDGTVVATQNVEYGSYAATPSVTPSRVSDLGFVYTFKDWGVNLATTAITHAIDFYATYTSAVRTYPVRFLDVDGTVLLTRDVAYGDVAGQYSGDGEVPVRDNDADCFYQFANWDSDPTTYEVTHSIDFHAIYSRVAFDSAYTFTLSGGNYILSKANTEAYPAISQWSIPETYHGSPVTQIGDKAFKMDTGYSSRVCGVRLSDGLVTIGSEAFANTDIAELDFGSAFAHIMASAVNDCPHLAKFVVDGTNPDFVANAEGNLLLSADEKRLVLAARNLETLVLPTSVEILDSDAISSMSALTSVTLTNKDMVANATGLNQAFNFTDCPLLTSFLTSYGEGVDGVILAKDGVLYSGTALIRYPQAKSGDFVVPSSVTIQGTAHTIDTISNYSFYQANVGKVSAESGNSPLRLIASNAFAYSSVSKMDFSAFETNVTVEIQMLAFDHCLKLSLVNFRARATVGSYAFDGDSALLSATFREDGTTMVSFDECAFRNCTSLVKVILYSDSCVIGKQAFLNCPVLLYVGTESRGMISVSAANDSGAISGFEGCTSITSIIMATSDFTTTDLPDNLFKDCTGITTVFYMGQLATDMTLVQTHLGTGNEALDPDQSGVKWLLFASTKPATNAADYWHYVNGVPTCYEA